MTNNTNTKDEKMIVTCRYREFSINIKFRIDVIHIDMFGIRGTYTTDSGFDSRKHIGLWKWSEIKDFEVIDT